MTRITGPKLSMINVWTKYGESSLYSNDETYIIMNT